MVIRFDVQGLPPVIDVSHLLGIDHKEILDKFFDVEKENPKSPKNTKNTDHKENLKNLIEN